MYVIKNISEAIIILDGVPVDPGQQLSVATTPSEAMFVARDAGALEIKNADETLAERQADVATLKPFKSDDPAI